MKNLILSFLLCCLLFTSQNSIACINGKTHILKKGYQLYTDNVGQVIPTGHNFELGHADEYLEMLYKGWKSSKDIDYISDFALILTLQKRYKRAEELYLHIEKMKPGRYSTASNLGTLYELIGQNEQALFWIRKVIKINPRSHHGSEWIHANILVAKIRGQEFLTGPFILRTGFGKEVIPTTTLSQKNLINLCQALYYQLNERMSFIKPPSKNKEVANLLFEQANIAWLTKKYYEAYQIYQWAAGYGYNDPLLTARKNEVKKLIPPDYIYAPWKD